MSRVQSVWEQIKPTKAEADNMRARSDLLIAISDKCEAWKKAGMTQSEIGRKLGIPQPQVSNLIRGKISMFSLDALATIGGRAGLELRVQRVSEPVCVAPMSYHAPAMMG